MRYAGDRLKYTKVKPKRFDNLIVISKDEMKDLHKGIPIQRKGYNILYKVTEETKNSNIWSEIYESLKKKFGNE